MPDQAREAPQSPELEQQVLGAILMNNEAYYRAAEAGLRAEHFSAEVHGRIFTAIEDVLRGGKTASPHIVGQRFAGTGETWADLSPTAYLSAIAGNAIGIVTVPDHADTIVAHHGQRRLLEVGEQIIEGVYTRGHYERPQVLIEEAERALYQVAERRAGNGGHQATVGEAAKAALDMMAAAHDRGGGLSGMPTGLRDLDHHMGGLQDSDLIIIAGRPGSGKTSLATNMTENLAKAGKPSAFFSLEMSGDQLATRIMSEMSGLSSSDLRRGDFTPDDFERLQLIARQLHSLPIHIDSEGGLGIAQIAMRARRLKRTKGIAAVFVDYIQIMSGSGRRGESRVQEITEITMGLKALAKELGVPVIALSQLSRKVEERDSKRPRMADLRDSGSLEQDADIVLMVYREEYYVLQARPADGTPEMADWQERLDRVRGKAEIIIAKHRHAGNATVDVRFDAQTTTFSDIRRERDDRQMEAAF